MVFRNLNRIQSRRTIEFKKLFFCIIDFSCIPVLYFYHAGMAELADAQDLGSCEEIRVGSTPTTRTKMNDPTQSEQIVVSCSD